MSHGGALRVAAGIFTSRVVGLVRERVVAHYFGVSALSDVFATVFKGPNLLQNLLGEQSLSAAFIPIYSRQLEAGRPHEAGRFAGAVFGFLLATAGLLTLLGTFFARPIVSVFAPGYLGDAAAVEAGAASLDRFELAVQAVRILFPMTGVLVLGAWCLGVLNSHRRFFLPYAAPVLWSSSIIAALVWAGGLEGPAADDLDRVAGLAAGRRLLLAGCVGALVGGVLQFAVQLPAVLRVLRGFRLSLSPRVAGVREALKNFAPVAGARGVVQLSSYIDLFVASFLAVGAMAAVAWAQRLAFLPLSLFGVSIAVAELPELARLNGQQEVLVSRLERALRQMAFLTLPAVVAYLALGHVFVAALYRTGSFGPLDNWLVYLVLGGYTLGLWPSAAGRLLQTLFYAARDTRTPALLAVVRVVVSGGLGVALSWWWDRYSVSRTLGVESAGKELYFGGLGLAVGAGIGAWVEFVALRRALHRRVAVRFPWREMGRMLALAVVATLPAAFLWWALDEFHPVLAAAGAGSVFGLAYLAGAKVLGFPEADAVLDRLRLPRRSG